VRSGRGRGPPGRPALCGRGPFGRVHANCSSSTEIVRSHVLTAGEGAKALTTRVWKSVLVHSPVRSRCGRLSGLEMYLVRSVVKGSVLSYKHTTFDRASKQKGAISLIIYGSAAGEPPSKRRANAYVRYGQEHGRHHELRQIDGRRLRL
jgi:hypothetical protein